jgi:cytochrome c oxidase cbb3-type subunit 2
MQKIEKSAIATIIGIILLFSGSIGVTLIAPSYVDPSWTEACCSYQEQMYEVSDPNTYIGIASSGSTTLEALYHMRKDYTLSAFQNGEMTKIISDPALEKYITPYGDSSLKLTSRLLLLRHPEPSSEIETLKASLQKQWEEEHPKWREEGTLLPEFAIWELYEEKGDEAFALAPSESMLENWVDSHYTLVDGAKQPWHKSDGVIFINNPIQYRLKAEIFGDKKIWHYDSFGEPIESFAALVNHELNFHSRAELIHNGEHLYAIEGCWYCHTDQTRTLIQDVVLNGSAAYPAPPSSANEYIYQKITFPGTRRIGPDLSRVGVKRASRDWHRGHFWSPKTANPGSIMPSFQHFFDNDPRGTAKNKMGIPNAKFESIYQYLMTKGTRITPPTEAWWLGKDPIQTQKLIERPSPEAVR